jgi:dienelactone hydrolase
MASPEYEQLRKVFEARPGDPSDPPALVREKMHQDPSARVPARRDGRAHDTGRRRRGVGGHAREHGIHARAAARARLARSSRRASSTTSRTGRACRGRSPRARSCTDIGSRPEHRYPAALDDTLAVYRALLDGGTAPDRIAVSGDSCGGGIGIALLLRLRDAGLPLPAAFVGLTGWYDLEMTGDAARNPRGVDPYVDPEWIRARGRDYAGPDGDVRDPLVSPIHADLSGLPPMFLSCGEIDITRDDSTRLAARAGRDGVAVTLEVNPEMIHGFHGLSDLIPEGRASLERAGEFVRRHLP